MAKGKLEGKVTVVTGSGRGIGRAIALYFAKEGANVVTNAVHLEHAKSVADEITAGGGKAIAVVADVSKKKEVDMMIKKAVDKFGRIDILVNNAGVAHFSAVVDISEAEWDKTLDINLKGTFLCTQAAVKVMIDKKIKGTIINISSIAGEVGFSHLAHYCASKGGIIELTKELAIELASYGIRVNAIGPGVIETDMTKELLKDKKAAANLLKSIPLGRFGKPEDIAKIAVFLASSDADYITGRTIFVDGGWITQ